MSGRRISDPKGFQRATVTAALATLTRQDGPRRFLVADEVGLGKTVVARTVVAEMMKGKRRPLVVFYVASNLNIAHQNRAKLLELLPTAKEQKDAEAPVDRLTLAASPTNRPKHDRLHLYTLTPDTSVPLFRRRGGFGRVDERALIFRILSGRYRSLETTFFSEKCRGSQVSDKRWKEALRRHEKIDGVREIQDELINALEADDQLNLLGIDGEVVADLAERLRPSTLMGRLRSALAVATLKHVRPDLIIFDEFQKFRDLLIDRGEGKADAVTERLRGGLDRNGAGLLLLSATPYRPYSTRQDEAAGFSHHHDFVETIRFLFGPDTAKPLRVASLLAEFGAEMLSKDPDWSKLKELRDRIQASLRPVLSRTERPDRSTAATQANAMHPQAKLFPEDLRVFKHWVGRLRSAGKRGDRNVDLMSFAVPYWVSVPLPVQMLGRGYLAWRSAEKERRRRNEPTLRRTQRDRLSSPSVWPHPQFREVRSIASASRLGLPWIAPSLSWWELGGPWSDPNSAGGKLLIFSRFKAVPPAVTSLLSFALESSLAAPLRRNFHRAGEAQPLQLRANRPTLPALFFPSPTLIAYTDPRLDKPANLKAVRLSMRRQVGALLRNRLGVRIKKKGRCRPLWKLLAALEEARAGALPESKLPAWEELRDCWLDAAGEQEDVMEKVLNRWDDYAYDGIDSVTQSEVAALAEFALSGPGVVVGRALLRFDNTALQADTFREILNVSWNGLRPYLNRAHFQAILTRRGQSYIDAIPEAIVDGNLESVLDEHLWITSQLDADAVNRFPERLKKVLGLHAGRHTVHEPGGDGFILRCHAAMPFADAKAAKASTGDDRLRTDDLRHAFNSPFWPHVLATTSLGQEGLDFHVWCRQLLHWDLCSSPLDLEQREGRIQRFGSLSVRSALAVRLRNDALANDANPSPWLALASKVDANFAQDASGMSPWWSCPDEKIDRLFVVLPQSRQTIRFDQLSRQRWLYRLSLGQPHQQDFIETVSQLPDDGRHQYALDLSAWSHLTRVDANEKRTSANDDTLSLGNTVGG